MADDWRVSLVFARRVGVRRKPRYPLAVPGLLRSRLGTGVTISPGDTCIFLYAGTAQAAEEAEQAALWTFAQQGLNADPRIEWWDHSSKTWRDARAQPPWAGGAPPPAPQGAGPRLRRWGSGAAALVSSVIDGFLGGFT